MKPVTTYARVAMDLNEKLRIAWSRVEKDRRTDFLIGDFEYLAYAAHAGALLQELEQRVVEEAEFGVAPLRVIRVPKDTHSHTTRPGAVPEIDDRIVYQCLVDDLAEVVEPHLIPIHERVVHSYRYAGNREDSDMFSGIDEASYKTFQDRVEELAARPKSGKPRTPNPTPPTSPRRFSQHSRAYRCGNSNMQQGCPAATSP